MIKKELLIEQLNAPEKAERLAALRALKDGYAIRGAAKPCYVNNHIHTTYSFSPYSPAKAAYMAYAAGLATAGIMDHDSAGGTEEFIEAGSILGLPVTIGVETRVSFSGTPFESRLINNPDQQGVAYMALHGIAHGKIAECDAFFAGVRRKRNERNKKMSDRAAAVLARAGIPFTFNSDVLPYSLSKSGGTVTERTICYGAARAIVHNTGRGAAVLPVLQKLGLSPDAAAAARLTDADNPHYDYDLTGILKAGLVKDFYIDADDELPTLPAFIALSHKIGAIPAYAYLGDVMESVTGDKKAQRFEDGYLPELLRYLSKAGARAVAYMPSRNSGEQLKTLRALCGENGFFEISGEDINSSRQSFICPQLESPEFSQLIPATWALIGHEKAVTRNQNAGMFSPETIAQFPSLTDRIARFAAIGRAGEDRE